LRRFKFIEKSSLFFKKGFEIDSSRNIYRFRSYFGFKKSAILFQEDVRSIEVLMLKYSHYTGSNSHYGNSSSVENINKVYTLEITSVNKSIKIYNCSSNRQQVSMCANFMSSFLKVKISRKEMDLNKFQNDNLSREMGTDFESISE
jgi:hypothetical protein